MSAFDPKRRCTLAEKFSFDLRGHNFFIPPVQTDVQVGDRYQTLSISRYTRLILTGLPRLVRLAKTSEAYLRTPNLGIHAVPILAESDMVFRCQLTANSRYPLFNPSIVRMYDGNFLSTARSDSLVRLAELSSENTEGEAPGTNYVFQLNKDLQVLSFEMLNDSSIRGNGTPAEAGLIDCRLFLHRGQVRGGSIKALEKSN
jgi:hypothetical protein